MSGGIGNMLFFDLFSSWKCARSKGFSGEPPSSGLCVVRLRWCWCVGVGVGVMLTPHTFPTNTHPFPSVVRSKHHPCEVVPVHTVTFWLFFRSNNSMTPSMMSFTREGTSLSSNVNLEFVPLRRHTITLRLVPQAVQHLLKRTLSPPTLRQWTQPSLPPNSNLAIWRQIELHFGVRRWHTRCPSSRIALNDFCKPTPVAPSWWWLSAGWLPTALLMNLEKFSTNVLMFGFDIPTPNIGQNLEWLCWDDSHVILIKQGLDFSASPQRRHVWVLQTEPNSAPSCHSTQFTTLVFTRSRLHQLPSGIIRSASQQPSPGRKVLPHECWHVLTMREQTAPPSLILATNTLSFSATSQKLPLTHAWATSNWLHFSLSHIIRRRMRGCSPHTWHLQGDSPRLVLTWMLNSVCFGTNLHGLHTRIQWSLHGTLDGVLTLHTIISWPCSCPCPSRHLLLEVSILGALGIQLTCVVPSRTRTHACDSLGKLWHTHREPCCTRNKSGILSQWCGASHQVAVEGDFHLLDHAPALYPHVSGIAICPYRHQRPSRPHDAHSDITGNRGHSQKHVSHCSMDDWARTPRAPDLCHGTATALRNSDSHSDLHRVSAKTQKYPASENLSSRSRNLAA